jgi:hypothetical protein
MESFPYRAIVDREDQIERKPNARERLTKETEILMEKLYGKRRKTNDKSV